jgi:nicotinate phosphoribosyltransferase
MSIFDSKRLALETFKMTDDIIDKMRSGWYSDVYFNNTVHVLTQLSSEGYVFGNQESDLAGVVDVSMVNNGDLEVEMQFFTRRKPFSIIVGVDEAIAILKVATGYYDNSGQFINTYNQLEVEAVMDGTKVSYDGDPLKVKPILKVRGNYRHFGHLETALLGVLSVPTRIATNVYNVMVAAKGKQILFFPARFDHYKMQGIDGYAYWIAIQRYNLDFKTEAMASVSTHAQGDWWGGKGGGTISHSTIACFLGNTAEAMMQFARIMPLETPRIALVDFHNDCVIESRKVICSMWKAYWKLYKIGDFEKAERYKLYGVRPDTSGNMIDESIIAEPGVSTHGVTPQLVHNIRNAIDCYWEELLEEMPISEREFAQPIIKAYCEAVQIIVTGGFNADKIKSFEAAGVPVDIYGVGSSLLENSSSNGTNNDFTADIVKVKVDGRYRNLAKVGRGASEFDALESVE